jgi:hypothetical protein
MEAQLAQAVKVIRVVARFNIQQTLVVDHGMVHQVVAAVQVAQVVTRVTLPQVQAAQAHLHQLQEVQ